MRRSIDGSSMLSSDDLAEYDIISEGQRSLESSIADLGLVDRPAPELREPPPSQGAIERFGTPSLTADDIQGYVKRNLTGGGWREIDEEDARRRVVRVYVDGPFDPMNVGCALRMRQAKLAFPLVHLMVGVFSDAQCERHGEPAQIPHVERCELVRHCRWVDEVVPEAPWRLDEVFLRARRIDYVAIDEGASVNPAFEKERVKGYDLVKSLNMAIPTRPTTGLSIQSAPATPDLRTLALARELSSAGTIRAPSALARESVIASTEDTPEEEEPVEPLVDFLS